MAAQKNKKNVEEEPARDKRVVYTVTMDYCATGEGRTIIAYFVWAENAKDAKARFAKKFNDYFAIGAEVKRGVRRNPITDFLFSDKLIETVKDIEQKRGSLNISSHFYFSYF